MRVPRRPAGASVAFSVTIGELSGDLRPYVNVHQYTDRLVYSVIADGTAEIVGYNGKEKKTVTPETLNG